MTHAQLKQFFKSVREPGWTVLILFNVVLLCFAIAFVTLIFMQKIVWNRGPVAPATTQVSTQLPVTIRDTEASTYTVQAGDSLWSIAVAKLGQGERYEEISALNQLPDPNQLRVGQTLELPASTTPPATQVSPVPSPTTVSPDLTPVATHVVQKGESLWSIAQEYLGSPLAWPQLYQANRDLIGPNPDLIYPGQELQLPLSLRPAQK